MSERACEGLAQKQFGVVSLDQALALKLSRRRIKTRVDSRRWVPVLPAVYRLGGAPETWRARAQAALLWAGPGWALSHESAAALFGLDAFLEAGAIRISGPGWLRAPRDWLTVYDRQALSADLRSVSGLRATTVERTLVDLAGLSLKRLERALDDALVQRLTTAKAMLAELRSVGTVGRAGMGDLKALVEARTGPVGDSHLEAKLIRILTKAKLPIGEQQVAITDRNARLIARVDFAYPEQHLVIQCDGYRWHGGRRQFDQDLDTRARLTDEGWHVMNVTHRDVTSGVAPLLARLRRLLKRG